MENEVQNPTCISNISTSSITIANITQSAFNTNYPRKYAIPEEYFEKSLEELVKLKFSGDIFAEILIKFFNKNSNNE